MKFAADIEQTGRTATGIVVPDAIVQALGAGGDRVEVELELDIDPRVVSVPQDFRDALEKSPTAAALFDGLAYSHRLRYVLSVEDARTTETRRRRIATAVEMLTAGKK